MTKQKVGMYSIGEISKLTNLSARAIRLYVEKGLVSCSHRGNNGYRYFSPDALEKLEAIRKLKQMKFSLEEIKNYLAAKDNGLIDVLKFKLETRLEEVQKERCKLDYLQQEIELQLLVTNKLLKGESIDQQHRRIVMDTIKQEVLEGLKEKKSLTKKDLEYLKREEYLFDTEEKREFLEAVKNCLEFAKKEGIKLGPARGSSPALLSLYALGWGDFDPIEYDLVPERFMATNFDLHIDVEFNKGKKFVDYCKGISSQLSFGKIEAFRLPIIDIIENVQNQLEGRINFDSIDNDDPRILDLFRVGDIDYIFSFDIPPNTILSRLVDQNYYREGKATKMLSEYLKSQEIFDFEDLLKIEAIFRPDNLDKLDFMKEYIERYPKAKKQRHFYHEFNLTVNEYLSTNHGVIIYQEDLLYIVNEYTGWDYLKCNEFRRQLINGNYSEEDKLKFISKAGESAFQTLLKEAPVLFCKAHSVGAWPKLIKATAILKVLHKDIYLSEIKKWEAENPYSWGDFGFIQGGISILQ